MKLSFVYNSFAMNQSFKKNKGKAKRIIQPQMTYKNLIGPTYSFEFKIVKFFQRLAEIG